MFRIDEIWADGGTVNCRTRVIRERTMEPQGVRRRHRAGIAVWGLDQTRPQGCEAVWLLSNEEQHPFSLSKGWSYSIDPTHKLTTTALGRRSRSCTAQEVSHMVNEKQAKPCMSAVFSTSFVRIRVEGVSIWVHVGWYSTDP